MKLGTFRWNRPLGRIGRFEIALGLGLVLAAVITSTASFSDVCGQIRDTTLRLHIRAASDSAADQADKLAVRDAVVEAAAELFEGADSLYTAEQMAKADLGTLQQAAQDTLDQRGSPYTAKVYLTRMYFATTHYDNFTMPAGQYDALRVDIGPAEGKNWWCVLFPPLCLPAAEPDEETTIYTEQQQMVLQSGYEIKFAVVEFFQRLTRDLPVYDGC